MKTWFKKGKIFDVGKLETLIFSLSVHYLVTLFL